MRLSRLPCAQRSSRGERLIATCSGRAHAAPLRPSAAPARRRHAPRAPRAAGGADIPAENLTTQLFTDSGEFMLDDGEPVAVWARRYALVATSAASLYLLNEGLTRALAAAEVAFPAPLAGMLLTIAVLCVGKALGGAAGDAVDRVVDFYAPLRDWVARWMPIFFVPSLIVLPRATEAFSNAQIFKVAQVSVAGWALSLGVAVVALRLLRSAAHTDIDPDEVDAVTGKDVRSFVMGHYMFWTGCTLVPLVLAAGMRSHYHVLGSVFLLSCTVKGYLYGVLLPRAVKAFVHPLLVCTLYGVGCCALWGFFTGTAFADVLGAYLATEAGAAWGAGNYLMSMLAVVVLCDGQRVYLQRKIVRHHAVEILGTCLAGSLFSLFATAALAKWVGLGPTLARSLLPRSITVALALPMTDVLGGSASVTAAVVCFTGLIGAAFGQTVLSALGIGKTDEISRGCAQASSAHGLGASALAEAEPEALPFAAVAIAAMGTLSNLLLYVPAVRGALLAITG